MKRVLFICVENSCRSQMAEGFARALGEGILEAYSAGSKPSGQVNPQAIEVMREKGIDLSGHLSKGPETLPPSHFDYVVTMGCGDALRLRSGRSRAKSRDACPTVPARQRLDWNISDPKGKGLAEFRKVRDEIEEKVRNLLAEGRRRG